MVKKIVNKLVLLLVLTATVFFAGCSGNNDPVIRDVLIEDKVMDGDTFKYTVKVRVAIDREVKVPETYVAKFTSIRDGSDFSVEKEGGFMPGDKNDVLTKDLLFTEYNGEELAYRVDIIQGTEVLDSQEIRFTYEE